MLNQSNSKIQNSTKGFSLLETITAIAILLIVITGFYDLALLGSKNIKGTNYQITAYFLGQEVQEYVSNIRMTNVIQGNSWLDGLGPCGAANGCYIDAVNSVVRPCNPSCPKIKYDAQAGYNYNSGDSAIFTRKITIEEIQQDIEAKVRVEMNWQFRNKTQSVILENRLFNWSQNL